MALDDESANDESGAGDVIEPGDVTEPGDVIEHGTGPRRFDAAGWLGSHGMRSYRLGFAPTRGAAVLAAVTLLAGLAVGYAAGRGTSGTAPPPSPSATSPTAAASTSPPPNPLADVGPAVDQLTASCSSQSGTELQLGIEVSNTSSTTVTLTGLKAVFPESINGALRELSWQWGPCGAIVDGPGQPTVQLAPGASAWLSAAFKVLVRCPSPYPVQFNVAYVAGDMHAIAALPGFSDLSQVPYSGCPSQNVTDSGSPGFPIVRIRSGGTTLIVPRPPL